MKTERPSRKLLTALALVAVLVAGALPVAAQDVLLRGLRGEQLREADLAQGTTIIVVWASWSPRGRDVAGRVDEVAGRWGGRARVITVNFQEDRGTVEGFLRENPMRVPVFLDADGAFSKKNAVTNLPGLLVIKDGATAFRGKLPADPDSVLSEVLR
ncbi:MAG TPA: TlpA disulfide reductase family protein [Thermoanaerobaculia bacterium]|nr:TlpA disulfide reductase family protein [Thermoanaerobaculia bacterium]